MTHGIIHDYIFYIMTSMASNLLQASKGRNNERRSTKRKPHESEASQQTNNKRPQRSPPLLVLLSPIPILVLRILSAFTYIQMQIQIYTWYTSIFYYWQFLPVCCCCMKVHTCEYYRCTTALLTVSLVQIALVRCCCRYRYRYHYHFYRSFSLSSLLPLSVLPFVAYYIWYHTWYLVYRCPFNTVTTVLYGFYRLFWPFYRCVAISLQSLFFFFCPVITNSTKK